MSEEYYSLVLNSTISTNIINNTSRNSIQYFINWASVLPDKYQRYNLTFTFTTDYVALSTSASQAFGSISVNFGNAGVVGQNSATSTFIGQYIQYIGYCVSNTPVILYAAGSQDNPPTTISYPQNNIITVNITDVRNSGNLIPNYILRLCFKPVINQDQLN